MRPLAGDDGLAVLYTALLMPAFLVLLAFVIELGALRVTQAHLVAAADLAATTATTEQDRDALARDGRYRIAPSAEAVARDMLERQLEPAAAIFADATPRGIASAADVAVLHPGETDPVTGRAYDAPTVRIAFEAPIRTPLFLLAALRDSVRLSIIAAASAR